MEFLFKKKKFFITTGHCLEVQKNSRISKYSRIPTFQNSKNRNLNKFVIKG